MHRTANAVHNSLGSFLIFHFMHKRTICIVRQVPFAKRMHHAKPRYLKDLLRCWKHLSDFSRSFTSAYARTSSVFIQYCHLKELPVHHVNLFENWRLIVVALKGKLHAQRFLFQNYVQRIASSCARTWRHAVLEIFG